MPKMYVHLRKEAAEIYAYERGRLAFANTFACKETNDRLYYILCVWKQLGMAQERDELHLTGELYDKEQLLPELKKFIRQVFIMNPAPISTYKPSTYASNKRNIQKKAFRRAPYFQGTPHNRFRQRESV